MITGIIVQYEADIFYWTKCSICDVFLRCHGVDCHRVDKISLFQGSQEQEVKFQENFFQ